MTEVWREIPDCDGFYLVSTLGRVESLRRGSPRPMTPRWTSDGYAHVVIVTSAGRRDAYIHRLVLEAFMGPPPDRHRHAAHRDGNTHNNALINLYWATPKENQDDIDRHGRRRSGLSRGTVLTPDAVREIRSLRASGWSYRRIAAKFGVHRTTTKDAVVGRSWAHVA